MKEIDYVVLFAEKVRDDNRYFEQHRMLINSQLRSSQELFRRAFGDDFKTKAREYLRARHLI